MRKLLNPISVDNVEKEIINRQYKDVMLFLIDTFYSKIKDIYDGIFSTKIYFNSIEDDLLTLIKKGKVKIIGENTLQGQFNSKVSKYIIEKLGGVYNKRRRQFTIRKLPDVIINWINTNKSNIILFKSKLNDFLDDYTNNLEYSIKSYESILKDNYNTLQDDLENKITGRNEKYIVRATLNERIQNNIRENYIDNMKKVIHGWQEKNIQKLREDVEYWALGKGYSDKGIAELIMKNYNTTEKKAKFLARNETSLVLSEYSKQKYLQNGITKYRWQTSGDERVRDRHRELNGKVFEFSNPPIVDLDTGKRGNPGEDIYCRCVAIPVLDYEPPLAINKMEMLKNE